MRIIFLILFLYSEFTTLIWLSKQRKLLFNMFLLSQHYLKGSIHSNMLIREGEWYFNSIHRKETLNFFSLKKFFSSFSNWRNIHNDCSWSKEILGAEFRQTRNCSQSEGIYSRQSLSEQVCFTLLFSTPKKTDMFTLYNLILCLSTQEIIHNLGGSIWSLGSFTQPHFTFNFINFLFLLLFITSPNFKNKLNNNWVALG